MKRDDAWFAKRAEKIERVTRESFRKHGDPQVGKPIMVDPPGPPPIYTGPLTVMRRLSSLDQDTISRVLSYGIRFLTANGTPPSLDDMNYLSRYAERIVSNCAPNVRAVEALGFLARAGNTIARFNAKFLPDEPPDVPLLLPNAELLQYVDPNSRGEGPVPLEKARTGDIEEAEAATIRTWASRYVNWISYWLEHSNPPRQFLIECRVLEPSGDGDADAVQAALTEIRAWWGV